MRIVDCSLADWRKALRNRVPERDPQTERVVADIIAAVRSRGDEALLEIARRFDSPHIQSLKVTEEELEAATIPTRHRRAIEAAYFRILSFHRKQVENMTSAMTPAASGWSWRMPTEEIGQWVKPLCSVGLYVPGGRASYPSSVLMLAGPARAAGVKNITVTTPCMGDGSLPPSVLIAFRAAGVHSAYKIGGASAIAALAFGTESVPRVDKIAGPGNLYVNEAKRQLWGSVGLDGNYGPSEVCVVIDDSTNPRFAAADLLAQLEHAPDNLGFLVSLGMAPLKKVELEIERQVANAPRLEILRGCLDNVQAFVAQELCAAAEIVNEIAPEHLSLSIKDPDKILYQIRNAGCVLIGDWTPESAADYCLGPSHTLPTGAAARFANPVSALDFLKIQSFAALDRPQFQELAEIVEALGEAEGFPAHGFASSVRRQ